MSTVETHYYRLPWANPQYMITRISKNLTAQLKNNGIWSSIAGFCAKQDIVKMKFKCLRREKNAES